MASKLILETGLMILQIILIGQEKVVQLLPVAPDQALLIVEIIISIQNHQVQIIQLKLQ